MDPKQNRDEVLREFVERRVGDLDRRREQNLTFKLEAIEKLLNQSIITKAEALSLAITRIQSDRKDCHSRCINQVKQFYTILDSLKEKDTVRQITIDNLKEEIRSLKSTIKEMEDATTELEELIGNVSVDLLNAKNDILNQEKDIGRFPLKVVAITCTIVVVVLEIVYKIGLKLLNIFIKSGVHV